MRSANGNGALATTAAGKPKRTRAKAKSGGLTKARRVQLLQQGYTAENFFGNEIRRRESDGLYCVSDAVVAGRARYGEEYRLPNILRNITPYLTALAKGSQKTQDELSSCRIYSTDLGDGSFLSSVAAKAASHGPLAR
jgi:hypothetical protein